MPTMAREEDNVVCVEDGLFAGWPSVAGLDMIGK